MNLKDRKLDIASRDRSHAGLGLHSTSVPSKGVQEAIGAAHDQNREEDCAP